MKTFLLLVLAAGVLVTSARSRAASPSEKAACLDAVSTGQTLRDAHKLVEAREQFRICARASCPTVVQSDCATWVTEIEAALPYVVLSAKDSAGKDLLDVKVSIDDQPLATALAGQALPVNPGPHKFRFDLADGTTTTEQVVVREGEKLKSVAASFSGAGQGATATGDASQAASHWSTTRFAGVIVGAAGIVAAAVGIGVAFDAKSRDKRAAGEMGAARQTDSSSAVAEGNVATAVLSVGAAMATAGVILWFVPPTAKVAVGTTGTSVLVEGRF